MANNEKTQRRLKGYYPFAKKYPSRRGNQAISESRRTKKRERIKKIVLIALLVCLFLTTFVFVKFCYNLFTRPLAEEPKSETPIITNDNIGTIRATYIENGLLEEITDLSKELEKAKQNGFNAVMLDFKTQEGYLTYKSDQLKVENKNLFEVDEIIIEKIKSEGFILVGRIFCFEDTVAPQRIYAPIYANAEKTELWFDNSAILGGKVWLDPTSSRAQNYLCEIIEEVTEMGADCVYLDSVQFPVSRQNSKPVYTDDTTLNRNTVLLQFIEKAVESAEKCPVIIGVSYEGAVGGNQEKWGGTLFDTPAAICSPTIENPQDSDYVEYIASSYIVLNDTAQNNFSTIKIIPTVKNQPEDIAFYQKLAESQAESYIIVP